jgi:YaiO family outer membrane protein
MNRFFFILLLPVIAWSQPRTMNIDSAYREARQLAFEGKRNVAETVLLSILAQNQNYSDGRLLLARIYAWDERYTPAIQHAQEVLKFAPHYVEAHEFLIDVFIWSHQYESALNEVQKTLELSQTTSALQYKKALIYYYLGQYHPALGILDSIIDGSLTEEVSQLKKQIQDRILKNEVSLSAGVDVFSKTFKPAYYSSLQMVRKNTWGTFILRSNYANRFNRTGWQPEVELYPRISEKSYAFVNYGYSNSSLFPQHRFGAEWFTKLSKKIEGSIGVRHLRFQSPNSVWIYTNSFTWYKKSFMLTIRPSLVQGATLFTHSLLFSGRKYWNDKNDFVSLSLSNGVLPDERRLQSGTGLNVDGRYTVRSKNISVGLNKQLASKITGRLSYEFQHREISYNSEEFLSVHSVQVMLLKRF